VVLGAMLAVTSFTPVSALNRTPMGAGPNPRVQHLATAAREAYEQRRYPEAADAYAALIEFFPFDYVLHFNRACALAHDGKPDEAITALERAVRYGFEDAEALTTAKALQPLRDHPRFARIKDDARASRAETLLVHVPPDLDHNRPAPLVVLLHGRGSAPRNVLPAWTAAAERLGVVLVLPKGGTRLAPGRYGWEAQFPTDNAQLDWDAAEAAITRAVDAAATAYPNIDRGRVILAGFSQGGYVALRALHDHPERYLGVVTFVTVYNRAGVESWKGVPPKRAYLISGSQDSLCPHSRAARDDLTAAGFDVRYDEIRGMGHEIPPEYEALQARALRFVLDGRAE
jgi:phospholipase/carboxylesterase